MYAISNEVYGAYSVNVMRARMGKQERKEHDGAWGLDFGDPKSIRIVPQKKHWFSKKDGELGEHPMSESMAPSFNEELIADPSLIHVRDDNGWTFLHHQALAGSVATVQVLLDRGADVNAKTAHGMTPLQLAKSLSWDKVIALLQSRGADQ
jgi:hypothetical protein